MAEKTPEQIAEENGPREYLEFLEDHPFWSAGQALAGQAAWKKCASLIGRTGLSEEEIQGLKEIEEPDGADCQDCGGDGWDDSHTGLSVEGAKCYACENTGKDQRVVLLLKLLHRYMPKKEG